MVSDGNPVESSSSAVSWGPVIAGAVAAAAATLILMLLGSGLGLSVISPWTMTGVSAETFAVSAAAWLIVVQWLSAALGGYLAGRLRTKWVGVHDDEVYFRDTAHGFLAWALATVFIVVTIGSGLTTAVGSGVKAASTVAAGAASGMSKESDATAYFVDALFRSPNPAVGSRPEGGPGASEEATRILLMDGATGNISAEDRTYLAQLVASRAGLSQPDAEKRVDTVLKRVADAKTKAKQTADTARKAGLALSLAAALSLLVGAFIAAVAARLGGLERDANEEAAFASST
ncbi:hypothetical protein [Pseudaminobacter soli (ex Li et al. 2025)]|uniref:Transmembrane protein n=1 Tax=Pseudaminobacter soli (ex Li et al. 2025) TaxID=1295366 RepID=A0A2P7S189_9HYPH|nr:hypothetical protein [Mesorhizobium soli]PSJ56221.1 hypothetical protein C7I85_24890 [Mesorhizobium soli]